MVVESRLTGDIWPSFLLLNLENEQLQFFKSKMRKEKFFLLLRQYEEEMLDAFLQDDDYFSELTSLTFVTTRQN